MQLLEQGLSLFQEVHKQYFEPLDQILLPINNQFKNITEQYQFLSIDQLKFLFSLIIGIPLGWTLYFIRIPFLRYIFSTLSGLLLAFFVYESAMVSVLIYVISCYFLCLITGRKSGRIVFGFSLIYLSIHHIYRQLVEPGAWKMEVTATLMMLFCKCTSLAFCYSDGFLLEKNPNKLSQDQQQRALKRLPNFFKFFSFVNFVGSSVAGPVFDYFDFDNFINLKGNFQNIPLPMFDTLYNFGIALIYCGITATVLPKFDAHYLSSLEFGYLPFYKKLFIYNATIILIRVRYYSGWLLIQSAMSATGITYNQKTGKFDYIVTVYESHEFTHEIRVRVEKWNNTVQVWLRRYIYNRVYSEEDYKKSKSKAQNGQNITLFVSALWHGFYPGYFFTFLQWSILISVCKFFYRASLNKKELFQSFEKLGIVYVLIRWMLVNFSFNAFGVGFVLLHADQTIQFNRNTGWIFQIGLLIVYLFFTLTGFGQSEKKKKDEVKKEQ